MLRDAFHGRFTAIDLVRALLPPLRDHSQDPGMIWAREWREREARIEAAGPCSMCRGHARNPSTFPLLPHVFRTGSAEWPDGLPDGVLPGADVFEWHG